MGGKSTRRTAPASPKGTVGVRFVKHVRGTKWYRSGLADRIHRKHTVLRPAAHLVLGAVKVAGYAAAGVAVGAVEGTRRAAPHVKRHARKQRASKWVAHKMPTVERKRGEWRVKHAVTCVCGDTFTGMDELNKHYREKHATEARIVKPRPHPTLHPGYTRRTAGKVKVRPVSGAPAGRHRTRPDTAGHHKATAFVERHRTAIEERGRAVMSDSTSAAHAVARAWTGIGDTIPRGTEEVLDLIAGLAAAASDKADALGELRKTLIGRLNLDPLVVHGLTPIVDLADAEAAQWTAIVNTIETVYGPLLALLRNRIAVPNA
jgi:hypothetical protein